MIIEDISFDPLHNLFILKFKDNFNMKISYDLYNELNIGIGKNITEKEYLKMKAFNDYNLLLFKALNFLSYRLRTEKEIQNRLLEETSDITVINEIIDYLKLNKYLDDKIFIKKYYDDKSKNNKWSSRKIIYELNLKGISKNDFYEIITDPSKNDYNNANILVLKKLDSWREKNAKFELKNKIYRFLSSKGFSHDIIITIIEEHVN